MKNGIQSQATLQPTTAPSGLSATDLAGLAEIPWEVLELVPAAVYVCDGQGKILRFNQHAAELWGRAPVTGDLAERFCGSYRMYRLDGGPMAHDQCPMADVLRTGAPAHDQEVVIERPDGTRATALVNISPIIDSAGTVVGAVNCFVDITDRKRMEQAHQLACSDVEQLSEKLKLERDQTQALIDALPTALYTTDADGRITYYNEAAAELWKYRPELGTSEFCGSWKLYHRDGRPLPHDACPMARALREQRPIRGEQAVAERPDGTRVPFMAFPTPLFDAFGRMTGAVNMLVDMSERDRQDSDIRAKEARFRALVAASAQIVWTMDPNGLVGEDSASWRAFTGQTLEEFYGNGWLMAVHPDDRERVRSAWQKTVASKSLISIEYRLRHATGAWRWMQANAAPVTDKDGTVREWVGMNVDITERKDDELAKQRLAAIVESSADAIVGKDLNGIIQSWNSGAERVFGYAAHEMIGRSITLLIPQDRQSEETEILARLRRGERIEHYETVRQRKDGTLIDVSLSVSPLRDGTGTVVGASKIARDISARKQADARQELLNRELQHRTKNMYAVVQSVVAKSLAGKSDVREAERTIRDRLQALAQTHTMLLHHNWHGIDLAEIAQIETSAYAGRVVCEGPAICLSARAAQNFGLALHELATNAAKYGALGHGAGRVEVRWSIADADGEPRFDFCWRETGGPPVVPPQASGFGSVVLVKVMSEHLDAPPVMQFAPEGFRYELSTPLHRIAAGPRKDG